MLELPSLLGEYLMPLVLLVPLAVLVLLIVARSASPEEPWSDATRTPPGPSPDGPARGADAAAPGTVVPSPGAAAPPPDFPTQPYVLPLQPARPGAPVAGAAVPVLVVDDSAVVRAKLGKLLTEAGYDVSLACHGHEALERLGERWFALMVTDLEMPEMDGFALIAQVGGDLATESMPIIAITGHEALHAKVHDAKGLYGIFKKPWNDRELLQRVAALSALRPRV